VQLLVHSDNEDARKEAASILGEIGSVNNKEVNEGLLHYLYCSEDEDEDEDIRRRVKESFAKIHMGNKETIARLVQSLHSSENESAIYQAADAELLGEIAPIGNSDRCASETAAF